MATLIKNVMINGKVHPKGKTISAATIKKLGLGDHLFGKEPAKAEEPKTEEPKGDSGDKSED